MAGGRTRSSLVHAARVASHSGHRCAVKHSCMENLAVPPTLRPVDPTRPPSIIVRVAAAIAATGVARFLSRHLSWKLDPLLLQASNGRLSTALVFPTAVLATTGAKTGARRRHVVIYFHDGDRVIIAASNAGSPRHPAWYHNLRANPDVTLGDLPMRATTVVDTGECQRLWELADRVFPAFARYRHDAARTHRTIPLVQLAPGGSPASAPGERIHDAP